MNNNELEQLKSTAKILVRENQVATHKLDIATYTLNVLKKEYVYCEKGRKYIDDVLIELRKSEPKHVEIVEL